MQVIEQADLSKLCTFKIGQKAAYLINWNEKDELSEIIKFIKEKRLPFFVFGGGSNLLFPDNDLNAVIVRCMTKEMRLRDDELYCDAGVRWPLIQAFCKKNGLFGLENFYGLPGTIGGAVVGNAGCHGQEMKDVLTKVDYFDLNDQEFKTYEFKAEDFDYRTSLFKQKPKWIVVGAYLQGSSNAGAQIGDPNEFAQFRAEHQPQGLTTGSFFKNPYPEHAGKLLEEAGLKGHKVGGVGFSEKHANFVINDGTGRAADVLKLTKMAQKEVKEQFGIELEPEVRIITDSDLNELNS